jgi:phosphoribosylformylglycinamidine synthase II
MPISKEFLDEIALSEGEYREIVRLLGREPNPVELGMFGALWSEHCGYKHSKALLRMFPARGQRVLVGPGEENAGAVDIGGGLAVVMKMESHNHPSAIEPFQGAATGVGGIVRDIFTMGARPIALLNSLRFGPLAEARNRYLFGGVVGGIASYGNCLGIPDVGGELFFSSAYSHNPLVNALCLGLIEKRKLVRARAQGEGNPVFLVGADTGRDGLHGASGLASRTFEDERELRSAVQVGNPFMEKLLIEACLELAETGWIVGMGDLGAAGLTSSAVEAASRAGSGIEIDIDKVPRREQGMTPYEVMLAESQERMLIIGKKGCEEEIKCLFSRWGLTCSQIGGVTGDGLVRIKEAAKPIAQVPVKLLTEPPSYTYAVRKPSRLRKLQAFDPGSLPDLKAEDATTVFLKLLASPNTASKEYVYRQYDHQVMINTVLPPGGDAAVLRVKGTERGLALVADGNGRYCYLDPYRGGALAVAEAARNLACVGAEPLAITDCLNLGNPERPDVFYQLKEVIRGMAHACRVLGIPVISGNVSLYNETRGQAIYPTPVVGIAGLLEDIEKRADHAFKKEGDMVFLLGVPGSLAGSEYLELVHGLVEGRPGLDLALEKRVQRCLREAIKRGLLSSAHDVSEGGLAVALAECSIAGDIGFRGTIKLKGRLDEFLFGEGGARVVVSVPPDDALYAAMLARKYEVPLTPLGTVGGDSFGLGPVSLKLSQVAGAWKGGLEEALESDDFASVQDL